MIYKTANQRLHVLDLKTRQHPGKHFAARAADMSRALGEFLNQVLHQPALKLSGGLKFRCQPNGVAQFRNGADVAKFIKPLRFCHPAAARMKPGGQVI
jgi:hypothetical protein